MDKEENKYFHRFHWSFYWNCCVYRLYSTDYRKFTGRKRTAMAAFICFHFLFDLGYLWLDKGAEKRLYLNYTKCYRGYLRFFNILDFFLKVI